jgi:hypothetical protein
MVNKVNVSHLKYVAGFTSIQSINQSYQIRFNLDNETVAYSSSLALSTSFS